MIPMGSKRIVSLIYFDVETIIRPDLNQDYESSNMRLNKTGGLSEKIKNLCSLARTNCIFSFKFRDAERMIQHDINQE